MFTGTYTALVTPFRNGRIDFPTLERLIRRQIRAGVDGIVPTGTTGESPTLNCEEHAEVIRRSVKIAKGRVKILAGTGANSTREAIELTKAAEVAGADGSLQVSPYYNKPSQEGLFQHFRAIARATRLPIILYSIPGRCVVEIAVDTVVRLAKDCRNIVGIKEAGGNVDRVSQLRQALPKSFTVLSGDDALTLPFLSVGADGVISVASNVIPGEMVKLVRAFREGKPAVAQRIHAKYYRLFKSLFVETNPVPVKAALAMRNEIAPEVRLPLTPLSRANQQVLRGVLQAYGLLKK